MHFFKRKADPEDSDALLTLSTTAARKYTHEEVVSIMAMIAGVAFDGLLISEWSFEETDHWTKVEVTFSNDNYENWYFFKETAA